MKRLLLFVLVLSFIVAQAQSQTPSQKRPKLSPHSKRAGFAKPPHAWLKEMESDSSEMARQDERLRNSFPPHILAERQWFLQKETENDPTGVIGLKPNDPFDYLYPPHKQPLTQMQHSLQNAATNYAVQSFHSNHKASNGRSLSGTTQILSGDVQEAWVARYAGPGHADDIATAMVIDGSGNIYVTGSSGTVKYNPAGTQEWAQNFAGSPVALGVDAIGNVYVTGSNSGDYVTVKYNSAGQEQWVARYNGPTVSPDDAVALGIDAAGNVYVTGSSYDDDESYDYTTVKYNSAGKKQWVARYNGPNDWGQASALAVDNENNVYVTGTIAGSGTRRDFATIKYNSAGQKRWVATYNGPANADDDAVDLGVDSHGNVYVTGNIVLRYVEAYYREIKTLYAIATVKYNSAGQQQWVDYIPGLEPKYTENGIYVSDLAVDGDGNVHVAGSRDSDQWEDNDWDYIGGGFSGSSDDFARAVAVDSHGNAYVTGTSGDDYSSDFATVRYGTQGWVATYKGSGYGPNRAVAIAVDGVGNVYVAGSSVGSGTGYDYATIKYTQSLPPLPDAGPDKEICAGGSVSIGGNPTGAGGNGGPYTFSWTPTTGLDNPTAPNPIASPATTTTYTVTVTETSTGRAATDEVTITARTTGWSVAHIVDVDDVIFGLNQSVAPRDNRGLALSPDEQYLYLSYNNPANRRLVRKIKLSETSTGSVDPANNHATVVAQLDLGNGAPAKALATDDKGRVYLARPQKIWIYKSDLSAAMHTIDGFTNCEGIAVTRENGELVVYATESTTWLLKRFELTEGAGEAIAASTKAGLDGDGEVLIRDTINNIAAKSPRGLDVQSNGVIWVADVNAHRVFRFNSGGSSIASLGANRAMDIAIDEARGEVYVSQYTLRKIKVFDLNGAFRRFVIPSVTHIDLDGETGSGALSGLDVASCQRVFVVNEKGRSTLTGGDSPFSNVGDNNNVKAADTDPVLLATGSSLAKEFEVEEPEEDESEVAKSEVITDYVLEQNYPNPFNPSTIIIFALPEATEVSLKIYDVAGQLVQTLVAGVVQAGRRQVVWDGTNQNGVKVASGVYFYQLRAGEFKQVRKMSLVR